MEIFHKNSKIATVLSVVGCVLGVGGVIVFIDTKDLKYLGAALICFALWYVGVMISDKKTFQEWQEKNGTSKDEKIRKSVNFAMKEYQNCPCRTMLKYIGKLNPEAGKYIRKDRKENARKK